MGIFDGSTVNYALLLGCFLAGVAGCLVGAGGIWRSFRSLRLRVVDLEQAHLQLRNRGYSQKRWADKDQLEAELGELMTKGGRSAPRQRFDNDPPEF